MFNRSLRNVINLETNLCNLLQLHTVAASHFDIAITQQVANKSQSTDPLYYKELQRTQHAHAKLSTEIVGKMLQKQLPMV